jgi:hypothetical protein
LGYEGQDSGSADFLWLTPLQLFFIMATTDLNYLAFDRQKAEKWVKKLTDFWNWPAF